jgi:hypothetical protein
MKEKATVAAAVKAGSHSVDRIVGELYFEMAQIECTSLLLTLQSGISPAFRSLDLHLSRLIVLLGLAGKISESEFLCNILEKQPSIEEERHALQEIVLTAAAHRTNEHLEAPSPESSGQNPPSHGPSPALDALLGNPDTL